MFATFAEIVGCCAIAFLDWGLNVIACLEFASIAIECLWGYQKWRNVQASAIVPLIFAIFTCFGRNK